jgi:hypothetical protein
MCIVQGGQNGESCALRVVRARGRGASRRVDLIPFFSRVSKAYNNESPDAAHAIPDAAGLSRSHRSQQTGSSAQVAPWAWLRRGHGGIPIKALEVKSNNNNRAAPGVDLKTGGGDSQLFTPAMPFSHLCGSASCALRALSVALRAQRASVRSTRTPHRLRTRNRSSQFRCFPPWCPASTPAPSEGTHATPFVSLKTACLFSQSRAAADQMQICLPPLHPRALHCT